MLGDLKMEILIHLRRRSFIIALLLSALNVASGRAEENTYQEEADRLALELNWQQGSTVAEIGAGRGELTLAAAKRVGATGRVYTTEIGTQKLAPLEALAAKEKNITTIPAGEAQTNLPPECCDSIFMRLVYHHVTKPAELDASLFRSLKPGGLLAVIDVEPRPGTKRVEGVPENRGGHGMPQKILIEELTSAGFEVVKSLNEWPSRDAFHPIYIVVFRKPGA
ncbi:MAG: methyltransferase domain-containing protein [Terriglobia bacterium]|jgi:ubiquinone/menaquinone biosynthesis C-methylase UbiE